MKLLRIEIPAPTSFRSLHPGFKHVFRGYEEAEGETGFAPFVCAGPNGSGKSNFLEVLASIFFHLDCMSMALPDSFDFDPKRCEPDSFNLEYMIAPYSKKDNVRIGMRKRVSIRKSIKKKPVISVADWPEGKKLEEAELLRRILPDYIVAYASGENEILSVPFLRMRYINYDNYYETLQYGFAYDEERRCRMFCLDSDFNQAILLSTFILGHDTRLAPYRNEIGMTGVESFRIVINDIGLDTNDGGPVAKSLREGVQDIVDRLAACSTTHFHDRENHAFYFDYWLDKECRRAFKLYFHNNPLKLFQDLQTLLTLNLYTVSVEEKGRIYGSDSLYVFETVPTPASTRRFMRFTDVQIRKVGPGKPIFSKLLSDGENQLLHTLGMCTLYSGMETLFLLDEPETHLNPNWRANFVSRITECIQKSSNCEMLVTTHTPYIISDSRPERVLTFRSRRGKVSVTEPDYNTYGASVDSITVQTFNNDSTIGAKARDEIERIACGKNRNEAIHEISRNFGDSVDKLFVLKRLLDSRRAATETE